MQLTTNALLLLAVSATAMTSTTHHNHQQPQQLTPQGHYRHLGRANTTGVNPNLGMSSNKPSHVGHTGCGGGGVNVVEDSSLLESCLHTDNHHQLKTLPPAPPPLPLPIPPADPLSSSGSEPWVVRPVPSGTGIPTGGVKPTPFVYVSGAAGAVVKGAVVAGMGLGIVVAVLL